MRGSGTESPAIGSILVTLPVYNEVDRLQGTLERVEGVLRNLPIRYRLSVAEDGSTDGTKEVLARMTASWPELIVQSLETKMGRGYALRRLWRQVDADAYVFMDTDLSTTPDNVVNLLSALRSGYDVAIASRYVEGARVVRPPLRHWTSLGYNWLLRRLFNDGIRDHQCGLKMFTKSALLQLLPVCLEDSWFWDTEVIVRSREMGLRIAEIPVSWEERKYRRTSMRRLLSDVYLHGTGLIRLKSSLSASAGSDTTPTPQPASTTP